LYLYIILQNPKIWNKGIIFIYQWQILGYMREVTTVVEVDNRGRVTFPLAFRKALGIEDGGILQITARKIDTKMGEESENPLKALASCF
jgi:hypothetical protein